MNSIIKIKQQWCYIVFTFVPASTELSSSLISKITKSHTVLIGETKTHMLRTGLLNVV